MTLSMLYLQAAAQDLSAYERGIIKREGISLPFRFLSPRSLQSIKYPLVIFLHGGSEKGDDNEQQLSIGGRFFLRDSIRSGFPAYVLFPQCPANDSWVYFENSIDYTTGRASDWFFPFNRHPTDVTIVLKKLLDSLVGTGKIDPSHIYIAGISQGGMGVLDLVARFPDLFAAGISICGAGEPSTARHFASKVPLWLFHGDKDEVVPVSFSREFSRRIKRSGGVARYTEYPGTGHDSWTKAFAEPDLLRWLFAQHKG